MIHFNGLTWFILCIFIIEINEAKPQYDARILFNRVNGRYSSQQNGYRQGTLDEFLAIRSTTERPSAQQEPCYPQQYERRNKRSPHFKRKRIVSIYPVIINNNHQYVPTKPPYSHYGGYFCGNNHPYVSVRPPIHNNLLSHISNLFLGIFDESSQYGASSSGNNEIRPVHESNESDNVQNEVIIQLQFFFDFNTNFIICRKFNGDQANQSVAYKIPLMDTIKIYRIKSQIDIFSKNK